VITYIGNKNQKKDKEKGIEKNEFASERMFIYIRKKNTKISLWALKLPDLISKKPNRLRP
ncbi:2315_t:CDS:2, partial [Gigaspora margarita]